MLITTKTKMVRMTWTKENDLLRIPSVLFLILLTLARVSQEENIAGTTTPTTTSAGTLSGSGSGANAGSSSSNNHNTINNNGNIHVSASELDGTLRQGDIIPEGNVKLHAEAAAGVGGTGDDEKGTKEEQEDEEEPVESLVVETLQGRIRGRLFPSRSNEFVGGFLGVPYAEPPVQELRFRPPVRIKGWENILNATEFGPICYQPGEQRIWDVVYARNRSTIRKRKLENYHMSEDCLTLNVYVPLSTENGSLPHKPVLPVFFFIHGGSYYMNAGRLYPGQILASAQNLIVVTFNYRLGPLGFLSTGDRAASGNYGLMDQALALEWVYDNIRHFGGDRHKITLVGNSAGGASVMFHMFSELSKGKFVGITVQSGCSGAPWAIQHSPRKHAESLATKLNCPIRPTTDLVDCLRNFSPLHIMKNAKLEDGLSLAYAAVIDGKYGGKFLSAHPEQLIRQNQFQHVPVLTGFTRDEVTIWFIDFGPTTATKDLLSFVQLDVVSLLENNPTVTSANIAAMIHSVTVQYLYRSGIAENDTTGKTTSVSDFISDVGLKAPCIKEMNLLTKYNTKPVYLYEFNYYSVDDVKMGRREWIGSYHESELQFIFGEAYMNYSNHLRSYDDKKMSDLMMKIWGNFLRFGSPQPGFKPDRTGPNLKFNWHNYTEVNQDYAVLGLKSHMEKYFLNDRMLFWNFFFPIFRDYPFRYSDSSKYQCDDWEAIQSSWIFWILVSTTCILAFFLTVFLTFGLRKRFSRHSNPIMSNNNSSSRNNSNTNSTPINYRVTQNL